jgi:outer membrane scaffolding protein for murein synthesis (MipA/OmpV family)
MQRFFGVSAAQSASSGLPQFDAKAGVSSLRLSAGALYRLDRRWRLATSYSIARLEGDAGASPITEKRTQQHFFVSATYLLR